MKKIKLNAVLASVLSLGIVCSSSVHASGEGEQFPAQLGQQHVAPAGQNDEQSRILDQFAEYSKFRKRVMDSANEIKRQIDEYYNRDEEKNERIDGKREVNRQVANTLALPAVEVLAPVLERIHSLRHTWDDATHAWFHEREIAFLPSDVENYIDMIDTHSYEALKILESINRDIYFLGGLGDEKELFHILYEISKDLDKFFTSFNR